MYWSIAIEAVHAWGRDGCRQSCSSRCGLALLQSKDDVIASTKVGDYVHRNIKGSSVVQLGARGHCPNLSAAGEVIAAIRACV